MLVDGAGMKHSSDGRVGIQQIHKCRFVVVAEIDQVSHSHRSGRKCRKCQDRKSCHGKSKCSSANCGNYFEFLESAIVKGFYLNKTLLKVWLFYHMR